MIRLRKGRAQERAALFAIWEEAVRATHDFVTEADIAMYARLVREHYLPQAHVLVAADALDAPLGFIGVREDKIEALFVRPARHGQGIGRMLVEHVCERRARVYVDVNEQNPGARRFYARLGFAPVGRSRLDGCGRPYPILHLQRSTA
jgi:putative acetyltransferase